MDEVLLFGSRDPERPIILQYIGSSVVRDIPVEQWEFCKVYQQERRTIRTQWSFAKPDFPLAEGISSPAVSTPVERIITTSIVSDDGLQVFKLDEISNIFSYRARIVETSDAFAPPKGIVCPNLVSDLLSLDDVGIVWPRRYSVRVDALTSRGAGWSAFHLRVDQNDERKRIRYDYVPKGANHSQTIIIDYRDQLRYVINRELGSCTIAQGVDWLNVDPIHSPIEFFFNLHDQFIQQPPRNAWEYNGVRSKCFG